MKSLKEMSTDKGQLLCQLWIVPTLLPSEEPGSFPIVERVAHPTPTTHLYLPVNECSDPNVSNQAVGLKYNLNESTIKVWIKRIR